MADDLRDVLRKAEEMRDQLQAGNGIDHAELLTLTHKVAESAALHLIAAGGEPEDVLGFQHIAQVCEEIVKEKLSRGGEKGLKEDAHGSC